MRLRGHSVVVSTASRGREGEGGKGGGRGVTWENVSSPSLNGATIWSDDASASLIPSLFPLPTQKEDRGPKIR